MSGAAKLSTVIFDMDGCLVDTEQAYIKAWAHAFEVKGIPIAQVTEVSTDSSSEKVVIARSNVDFEHVEEVVVVLQVFEEVAQ